MILLNQVQIQNLYSLSPMQEGMLYHYMLEPESNAYFQQNIVTVEEDLEVELLQRSLEMLIERFDVFRTVFVYKDEERPLQVVLSEQEAQFHFEDLCDQTDEQKHLRFETFKREDRGQHFDLETDGLIRLSVFAWNEKKFKLVWSFPHIIMDGWCLGIVAKEFFKIYKSLKEARPVELASTYSYSSYIQWLSEQNKEEALEYWKKYIGDIEQETTLHGRKLGSLPETCFEPQHETFHLDESLTKGMVQLAQTLQVTMSTLFQTIWGMLLQLYNDSKEVVFGAVVSGRPDEVVGIEEMVGLFINTVPVKITTEDGDTFSTLVKQVQSTFVDSNRYSYVSLADIQANSFLKQNLIQHIIVFENYPISDEIMGKDSEEETKLINITDFEGFEQTNYDFDILIALGKTLEVSFRYNAACFEMDMIRRLKAHLLELTRQVVDNPDLTVNKFEIITEQERKQIVEVFNDTLVEYPKNTTIVRQFETRAATMPEQTAVVYGEKNLTYRELNVRVNQVARCIQRLEVQSDQIVGVMMERSLEMPVALLAILKAGGAYLPINPDLPEEHIRHMLQDSGAKIVLAQRQFESRLKQILLQMGSMNVDALNEAEHDVKIVIVDAELYVGDNSNLPFAARPEHLAYLIYTSGTTGKPKGVMIEHRSLINRLHWMQKQYPISKSDVILQKTPYNFDVSVWEQFWWVAQGAKVVFLEPGSEKDPEKIVEAVERYGITTIHFVPSMLSVFLDAVEVGEEAVLSKLVSLRQVFSSGEALNVNQAVKFNTLLYREGHTKLINLYGPTEATIDVSHYDCSTGQSLNQVPIGRPIDNTTLYVLSERGTLQPIGVPGELYIAGVQLARGYLNQPDLTAKKFVPNPFCPEERMYRTGDLVQWLPDGNIKFLGRLDHQVKIRGNRIELGEVETALRRHPALKEVIVIDLDDAHGEKYLCAYVLVNSKHSPKVSELREWLSHKLPQYMCPSHYMFLERFPLTPNGKIDRKSLPSPEGSRLTIDEYIAPRNMVEVQLERIWKEVLGLQKVGVKDNFFDIGGHSLRATTLIVKIHKEMNCSLPLGEVFQFPTIEQMAIVIADIEKQAYTSIPLTEKTDYHVVSSAQKRLYILNQMEGAELSYNMPEAMTVEGPLNRNLLEEAFRQVIRRHESLRTSFDMFNEEPIQRVHQEVDFTLTFTQPKEELEEYIRRFVRPFDLKKPPLLRVELIELEYNRHILLFDMHHIISDGASIEILIKEVLKFYGGEDLPSLRIQYKDYAAWQRDKFQSERMEQQKSYWLNVFQGELPVLELPSDFARPAVQQYEGDLVEFVINKQRGFGLRQLTMQTESTLYMVLLAVYTTLLYKYSGQKDIIVGTPIAGRPHADLESLIGMFVNTLAIRNYPSGEKRFHDYVLEVKEHALQSYENQDYPFEELFENLDIRRDLGRNPLFDTMFVLNNVEEAKLNMDGIQLYPCPIGHTMSKFDLVFQVTEQEDEMVCSFNFATSLYKRDSIERMVGHLLQLIDSILENPQQKLASIEMITPKENTQILEVFNNMVDQSSNYTTIVEQFEAQVNKTPEQIAVIYRDERLTYGELNGRVNQVARRLQQLVVQPDQIIGVMLERSAEMSVVLLAILKAGGAYFPIDPTLSDERIMYMLQDSGAKVVMTQQRFETRLSEITAMREDKLANSIGRVESDVTIVIADNLELYRGESSNLPLAAGLKHLAYILYTSGTTGNPKGVMIEHRSIANFLHWMQKEFPIGESDVILQKSPYTFDASVREQFWWALHGAKVVFLEPGGEKDPESMVKAIMRYGVTMIHFVPSMLSAFLDYVESRQGTVLNQLASLRQVFVGGEALSMKVVERFNALLYRGGLIKLTNEYGPTEATIDASYYDCSPANSLSKVPIGRPVDNTALYVINESGGLQPIGVPGELYIAGVQLARGYLNRPDLTAEKFVFIPFRPEERMYRTGDLVQWLPDGNIEYLGRLDHQVKIRGYRIELGEVETQFLNVAGVKEAVVIPKEDEAGRKHLCAYFSADQEMNVTTIRSLLKQLIPAYMIPSYFVQLECIPLTPNGKVDRKALSLLKEEFATGTEYVAPRSVVEQILISVWQEVLGVKTISIMDNFFELGGDSIKSIQVSSRLFQAGYKLEMRHMFKHPTIAELSWHVKLIGKIVDQREVTGEVKFTPIQHWFFEQNFPEPNHFNQAVMLYHEKGFDEVALRCALQKIAEHHDALRIIIRQTEDGYKAWNRGITAGELFSLEVFDFTGVVDCASAIEEKANEIQSSIRLHEGPLLKTGLFHCADGDHLLITIHHLVIDGVSWRILFEDLAVGYEQALSGLNIRLPDKTDSFQTWVKQLSAYANSSAMEREKAYWRAICGIEMQKLPQDTETERTLIRDIETISVQWTWEETEKLLKQAHQAYNTDMNDLLLTALGKAFQDWAGLNCVLVNLEGHGRESVVPEIDVTRTVGWFTSQYPVVLKMASLKNISLQIKSVKENLRRIPNKGIGYGLLKYLSETQTDTEFSADPEISFNYLGQFDQDLQKNTLQVSTYSSGAPLSGNMQSSYVLEINGMIIGGRLEFTISYSCKQYAKETMVKLARLFRLKLLDVIQHCITKEHNELTPSDLLFKGMTLEELEVLTEQTAYLGEIEDVYPLTPMQKGMLFHGQMDPLSSAYFEQMTFMLQGDLDVEVFAQSLKLFGQRHEVLRTNFCTGWKDESLQVVFRNKQIGFKYDDLRGMSENQHEAYIRKLKSDDMAKGFKLDKDSLMRMSIIRSGEARYHFLWSFHHILMDGWCLSIVAKEIFLIYGAISQNRKPELGQSWPYRQYLEWLDNQNVASASQYWSDYLAGYEHQTVLAKSKARRKEVAYVSEKVVCDLGQELTLRVQQTAKQQKVTVNTLIHTAWGILLQWYNGTKDVVFGNVVSGRPSEIPGIETMIGLFINTVPVRIRCEPNMTVAEVMSIVQEQALASQSYETYPLYEIQALSEQTQDLIDHIIIFENYPVDQHLEEMETESRSSFEITDVEVFEQTNYNFNLIVAPDERIVLRFEYNSCMYDKESIERIKDHFVYIMEQISYNPQVIISKLELLTSNEKSQILEEFNDTALDFSSEKTLYQQFEDQVKRTPDQVAIVYKNIQFTYKELNERANRLARTLRAAGVQTDQLVCILAERSPEMIIGMLAILKAGGAYVPIDPEYPEERIRYILKDSGARLLLLQNHLQMRMMFEGIIVSLDDEQSYHENGRDLNPVAGPNHIAYVIYTSGTTGEPKGVMIEHSSVLNYSFWRIKAYEFTKHDVTLQLISFSFDGFGANLYPALLSGGAVVLAEQKYQIEQILELIRRWKVTNMSVVPAIYSMLLTVAKTEDFTSLRFLVLAGEVASSQLLHDSRALYPNIRLCNEYGPTENTIGTTAFLDMEESNLSVIGYPIANHQVYIVDSFNNLLPVEVAGELCISGAGLARGYWNQPELTAEKFISNPFKSDERMYLTGDRARWLPNGAIEYLGRMDHQVKIRGFRIEVGEIETQILKHSRVKQAVVGTHELRGEKVLHAYYVADEGPPIPNSELRELIVSRLPAYMVPMSIIELPRLPLTVNGKIDRKALPAPEWRTGEETYVAPSSEVEQQLALLWEELLAVERVGAEDNFFQIGGHSLHATILLSRINKHFQLALPLRVMFEVPILRFQAEMIEKSDSSLFVAMKPAESRPFYPVTSSQNRLLLAHDLHPVKTTYNVPLILEINRSYDLELLEHALQTLIARHEAFRTFFELREGHYVQRICDHVSFELSKSQLSVARFTGVPVLKREEMLLKDKIKAFIRPFELTKAPLFRAEVVSVNEIRTFLMLDMHHAIADGVSMEILTEEFNAIYHSKSLSELPIQYKDYAVWLEGLKKDGAMERSEQFWLQTFDDEIPVLALPTDYQRPQVLSHEGARVFGELVGEDILKCVRLIAAETETTIFMVLLSVYQVLLHRYTGQEDLIIGTPVAGRPHVDVQRTIGMFVNTLPLRCKPLGNKSFRQLLLELKDHMLDALEHQMYPFEELVDKLKLHRDVSRHPLFDTLFTLQTTANNHPDMDSSAFKPYRFDSNISKFDLSLFVEEKEQTLQFELEYATKLFRKETVERLLQHYILILQSAVENIDVPIDNLMMLSNREFDQILNEFNQTHTDYPKDKTIHGLFEELVQFSPDRIAVVDGGTKLTYRELNERANCWAQNLLALGVMSQEPIGLMAERSAAAVIGMLGILKAGGAYLPIDPSYPDKRIRSMLEGGNVRFLLTEAPERVKGMAYSGIAFHLLDVPQITSWSPYPLPSPKGLAYIMYTSGSTGEPKGVMVEHRNVIRLVRSTNYVTFENDDRILLTGNLAFDACTFEIWGALLNGLQLHIVPENIILDSDLLADVIRKNNITMMWLTSPLFNQHAQHNPCMFASLKQLLIGGDVLSPPHIRTVKHYCPELKLINGYGPTENTTFSCCFLIEDDDYFNIPIGRPIANSNVYILDKQLQLQPLGVPGEIAVGGDGIARGYLNHMQLTKDKFIMNPFNPNERIYLTGDMGRWLPNGSIEYLGRIDHQVKIRGYRIELGEIEKQLLNHWAVNEAFVIAVDGKDHQKYLCAYVASNVALAPLELKDHLALRLPDYMIPSCYIMVERMPLNSNGKIDWRALPLPDTAQPLRREYEAPRTEAERRLTQLWQEVLGVEQVGIQDNFFEIGGHSLKAIQIVSRAKEIGLPIDLNHIFQEKTIKGLSHQLSKVKPVPFRHRLLTTQEDAEEYLTKYIGVTCKYSMQDDQTTELSPKRQILLNVQGLSHVEEKQPHLIDIIKEHIDPSLHPHVIQNLSEEAATTEQQAIVDEELPPYILVEQFKDLALTQLKSMYDSIISKSISSTQSLSGMQRYHLKHPEISGTIVELDKYIRTDLMAEALRLLIHRHELLRCTLSNAQWEVRQPSQVVVLPMLDLSKYSVKLAKEVAIKLISRLFYLPYDMEGGLPLYRVFLVKLNLREHVLVLPFSHIIFDYMSSELIGRELVQTYELLECGEAPLPIEPRSYSEYTVQLSRGPQGMEEALLLKELMLLQFATKAAEIEDKLALKRPSKHSKFSWTLAVDHTDKNTSEEIMWQIALSQVIKLCSRYLNVNEVPIWVTHFGRNYEQVSFFEMIGEFIDQIPILARSADKPESLVAVVKTRIDLAIRHNINFMSLMYDEHISRQYPEINHLLRSSLEGMPVVFNYVGGGTSVELKTMIQDVERYEPQSESSEIMFTARASNKQLHLSLVLPYAEEFEMLERLIKLNQDYKIEIIKYEEFE
ncbi:non-ribosomal peptide synthetase [Paenibacillus polymyxa]|uniref:non-ribosomal peptide synthetase n=1 Tax=Paenibacillus polymyxa TaxID=1406 RepID=UPI00234977A0|nr:non-ribosomal peptide synthetase [Paenibacillus polymyxa]WCM63689.1 amino acid adenylation domain-containing protein [Paenibacillus polymyxa]